MSKTTTSTLAQSSSDQPPPHRQAQRLVALMPVMILSGLIPGIIIGVSLGSPPPPSADSCNRFPDPIACLIQSLD